VNDSRLRFKVDVVFVEVVAVVVGSSVSVVSNVDVGAVELSMSFEILHRVLLFGQCNLSQITKTETVDIFGHKSVSISVLLIRPVGDFVVVIGFLVGEPLPMGFESIGGWTTLTTHSRNLCDLI